MTSAASSSIRTSSLPIRAGATACRTARQALTIWAPPPDLSVAEWADAKRHLSPESSARPGKFDTTEAEYLRAIQDAVADAEIETVVLVMASQTGKTTAEENVIGYHIDLDPCPILWVVPTLELANAFSKERLAPMIRDTPALTGKVRDPKSRAGGNTIRHKEFPGGHITLAGANSPASLSARPIRLVLGDEIDRWPVSAGTEGDPLNLAKKRSVTFWNRKHVWSSTPTRRGASRIWNAYEQSDRRRYWLLCPHCDERLVPDWSDVRWPKGQPELAAISCRHCGAEWSEGDRQLAIRLGEWRAEAPFRGTAGFHLPGLCSPWVTPAEAASEFVAAGKDPVKLQVWVNTYLAQTWEDDGERADPDSVAARAETWREGDPAPAPVLVATKTVDTQDDRLEAECAGWGPGEERWSIEHRIFWGDPSAPQVWEELDAWLVAPVEIEDGRHLIAEAVCIDYGGHHSLAVGGFCAGRDTEGRSRRWRWIGDTAQRVYAIRGIGGERKDGRPPPMWPKRPGKNNKGGVTVWSVGVDAAKDVVLRRLKIAEPGPGYCHFPAGRDEEYYRQLTAEKAVTKYQRGFPVKSYVKDSGQRNEAFDLAVYNLIALRALNVDWPARQAEASPPPPAEARRPVAPVRTPVSPPPARPQAPAAPPSYRPQMSPYVLSGGRW